MTDRADPKLAHIDGLNLSRAWMLEGIAGACPPAIPGALRYVLLPRVTRRGPCRR